MMDFAPSPEKEEPNRTSLQVQKRQISSTKESTLRHAAAALHLRACGAAALCLSLRSPISTSSPPSLPSLPLPRDAADALQALSRNLIVPGGALPAVLGSARCAIGGPSPQEGAAAALLSRPVSSQVLGPGPPLPLGRGRRGPPTVPPLGRRLAFQDAVFGMVVGLHGAVRPPLPLFAA
eukprot:CAMPEP_0172000770 /NCGR_PEP_ID=MMETSP1041-20130122/2495_1 /TAXON_ID=464988 /ORGANISM="Hemiselmis andersenii, Strain CCMP439" /LENGTH=178 /DNA_ID=CAMNT_0012654329 /DNA_START=134 /DNA_END=666 /DNA_ORIENTATION=-